MFKSDVAIIEFGSSKIRVLVGQSAPNNTFLLKASGESSYAGFMDGEFLEPNELKNSILIAVKQAELSYRHKIKSLYVGVPSEFSYCVCQDLKLNLPERTKIKQTHIRKMFEKASIAPEVNYTLINKAPIYYELDDGRKLMNPQGCVSSSLGGLASFIMVDYGFYNMIDKVLNEIGIYNIEFICSALAESVYLIPADEREKGAILVDCGYITTSVTCVVGDGITDLKSFSIGGGHITSDLAEVLRIPFYSAENLKRKVILTINAQDNDKYETIVEHGMETFSVKIVNEIVLSRLDMMVEAINTSIQLFEYPVPQNMKIYLTGGGLTYIKGAKDYISKALMREIEIITPTPMQFNKPELAGALAILDAGLKIEA